MYKVREEFEVWYSKEQEQQYPEHLQLMVKELMFQGWVGRPETTVVDLPLSSTIWWYEEVCDALDDAGVKYE